MLHVDVTNTRTLGGEFALVHATWMCRRMGRLCGVRELRMEVGWDETVAGGRCVWGGVWIVAWEILTP